MFFWYPHKFSCIHSLFSPPHLFPLSTSSLCVCVCVCVCVCEREREREREREKDNGLFSNLKFTSFLLSLSLSSSHTHTPHTHTLTHLISGGVPEHSEAGICGQATGSGAPGLQRSLQERGGGWSLRNTDGLQPRI